MPSSLVAPEVFSDSERLNDLRKRLLSHRMYDSVQTVENLRFFMREHVFAVWDFMSLLKRLQQVVTCCEIPWLPRTDASLARFINEIVLGEESDEDGRGGYASHFELYLDAMEEIGADTRPIREFTKRIEDRIPLERALAEAPILPSTREFVRSTFVLIKTGQPHEVAAAFFYGREDIIPDMFSRLVKSLPKQGVAVDRMLHYLNRHIELDANDHGPLARRLVKSLCANNPQREREAEDTACLAIEQRISLWDKISSEIEGKGPHRG